MFDYCKYTFDLTVGIRLNANVIQKRSKIIPRIFLEMKLKLKSIY